MRRRRTSAIVAGAAVLSAVLYVVCSNELRFELRDQSYKHALLSGFFHDRGLAGVRLVHRVDPRGFSLVLLLALVAAAAAFAIRRAYGQNRGRLELCVFAAGAITIPPLVLAAVLWPDGRGYLGSMALLVATAGAAAIGLIFAGMSSQSSPSAVERPGATAVRDPGRRWGPVFLALLVPLAIAVWWNGVTHIGGFDSLADHLPRAARWLRLERLAEESGPLLTPYYPGDFQLLLRWILVLGTDAYAFVPSLLASVVALCAIYGICRELGQPKWTAMVSTAAAASCSLIPYLSTTAQADTATAAWLLCAVFFLLRWLRTLRPPLEDDDSPTYDAATLGALGVSLGLALGTKYSALPSALVIAGVAVWHVRRASQGVLPDGSRFVNVRTFVVLIAAIAVPLLLGAGYWLLRNTVVHHNPLYPITMLGLPGVDLKTISIVKPALAGSFWKRATYPWVQWQFGYPYDDALGAVFPAIALVSFVAVLFRRARGTRRGLVWFITAASYLLWFNTGSIMARFGIFPILLTFVFVGEAWREFESVALKVVTLATFALGVGVISYSMVFGAVYSASVATESDVPTIVDTLPPSRIFNATSASNRYALLGKDYRHEVITMFRDPVPNDLANSRAQYVLLGQKQIAAFSAAQPLQLVESGRGLYGDTLSLWRVGR